MHDDLAIPDFLRVTPEEAIRRRQYWKGRKLTIQGSTFRPATKVEEAATKKLRKELEAAEIAKKAARFAALKELAAEKKASGWKPPVRKRRNK